MCIRDSHNLEQLDSKEYEAVHGGYDPAAANADPNRVLPLDALRDLEQEKVIGELYPYYYATVGNGTTVKNAINFAQEIAKDLVNEGINAVIISST